MNEFGIPNDNGTVVYTRINADQGAVVQGVNIEMNLVPARNFSCTGGFTAQNSEYQSPHEFNENAFFRTPNDYGYMTLTWNPTEALGISSSGAYTGQMLIPYFGNKLASPETGVLRLSPEFIDVGLKLTYNIFIIPKKSVSLQETGFFARMYCLPAYTS